MKPQEFTALFLLLGLAPALGAQPMKPNVIVIMADDQGSIDAGCYGAKDLLTPAMDRLAAQGVRFTQFYSAAPVCSPSRAALLTGRYPWAAGMPNNSAGPPTEADDQLETLTGPGHKPLDLIWWGGQPASQRWLGYLGGGGFTTHVGAGGRALQHPTQPGAVRRARGSPGT